MQKRNILLFSFCIILVAGGCSHRHRGKSIGHLDIPADMKRRTVELVNITEGKGTPASKAKAHLELAQIYYQCSNPDADYAKALDELEKYVLLEPEKSNTADIRNQLAVLRELKRQRKATEALEKKNAEISETMNKLHSLDVQLEQKRETMKQQTP